MGKGLEKALQILKDSSPAQHDLLSDLTSEEMGQAHLLDAFDHLGDDEFATSLKELGSQLEELNSGYPGGLHEYIIKAKKLLESEFVRSFAVV